MWLRLGRIRGVRQVRGVRHVFGARQARGIREVLAVRPRGGAGDAFRCRNSSFNARTHE